MNEVKWNEIQHQSPLWFNEFELYCKRMYGIEYRDEQWFGIAKGNVVPLLYINVLAIAFINGCDVTLTTIETAAKLFDEASK